MKNLRIFLDSLPISTLDLGPNPNLVNNQFFFGTVFDLKMVVRSNLPNLCTCFILSANLRFSFLQPV